MDFVENEPEEIVTKRNIDGALGILKACKNSKTVKRVVYTSSASAVYLQEKELDVLDESYWSDVNLLRTLKPFAWSYSVSKTLAEKAVLKYGQHLLLDPSFVLNFLLTDYSSLSFLFGDKNPFAMSHFHIVHVDDVARAHVYLFEHPNPEGRYNCSPFIAPLEEVVQILSPKYPEFDVPTLDEVEKIKGNKLSHLTSKKLKDAGFEFKYSVEEMLDDTIQCCKEKGYL